MSIEVFGFDMGPSAMAQARLWGRARGSIGQEKNVNAVNRFDPWPKEDSGSVDLVLGSARFWEIEEFFLIRLNHELQYSKL
jgi:hypothetical protein